MPKWTEEQVRQACAAQGWEVTEREIEHGIQFILYDGTPVNWYRTGTVVVAGKATPIKAEARKIFAEEPDAGTAGGAATARATVAPMRVFIVYGHDAAAREQLELILRRLRIEPIVLQNIPGGGDTIIEKLEILTDTDFACVLLTPDDEGYPSGQEAKKRPRARQNVVLEFGMVLAKLGRRRVAVLVKGNNLERPSDIEGLIYLPFNNHVDETKIALATNLQEAGFDIQVRDLMG